MEEFIKNEYLEGYDFMNHLYLIANVNFENVTKIKIIVESHDQGFSIYPKDHNTYNNSWTWGQINVLNKENKEKTKRVYIYTNLHANNEWQKHYEKIIDRVYLNSINNGDKIALWIRSDHPGWKNYVRHAKIIIYGNNKYVDKKINFVLQPKLIDSNYNIKFINTRNKKLYDVSLNDIISDRSPINFSAISYVWGENKEWLFDTKDYISKIKSVNEMKFNKLLKWCENNNIEYLWIDVISINQNDYETKNMIIKKLIYIYKQADYTLIIPSLGYNKIDRYENYNNWIYRCWPIAELRISKRYKILEYIENNFIVFDLESDEKLSNILNDINLFKSLEPGLLGIDRVLASTLKLNAKFETDKLYAFLPIASIDDFECDTNFIKSVIKIMNKYKESFDIVKILFIVNSYPNAPHGFSWFFDKNSQPIELNPAQCSIIPTIRILKIKDNGFIKVSALIFKGKLITKNVIKKSEYNGIVNDIEIIYYSYKKHNNINITLVSCGNNKINESLGIIINENNQKIGVFRSKIKINRQRELIIIK